MRNRLATSLVTAALIFIAFRNGIAQDVRSGSAASDQRTQNAVSSPDGRIGPAPQNEHSTANAPAAGGIANPQGGKSATNIKSGTSAAGSSSTKLHCRAVRTDLGVYEPLRIMSITVDPAKKYVKVVHEGDGQTLEFTDGSTSAQGHKNFVKVTDETIVYGQGREFMEDRSLHRRIDEHLDRHFL